MKKAKIMDILSEKDYRTCVEITKTCSDYEMCKEVARIVLEPNIRSIDKILGQKNDPLYLAYAIVYAIESGKHKEF